MELSTVFVSHLPPGVITELELDDIFSKFGNVLDIDIKSMPNRPTFAFVTYSSAEDSQYAVKYCNNYEYRGYYMKCNIAAVEEALKSGAFVPKDRLEQYTKRHDYIMKKYKFPSNRHSNTSIGGHSSSGSTTNENSDIASNKSLDAKDVKEEQKSLAVNVHNCHLVSIDSGILEDFSDDEIEVNVLNGNRLPTMPNHVANASRYCVLMSNLPHECSSADIRSFFKKAGLDLVSITMLSNGQCEVSLKSEIDLADALLLNDSELNVNGVVTNVRIEVPPKRLRLA